MLDSNLKIRCYEMGFIKKNNSLTIQSSIVVFGDLCASLGAARSTVCRDVAHDTLYSLKNCQDCQMEPLSKMSRTSTLKPKSSTSYICALLGPLRNNQRTRLTKR